MDPNHPAARAAEGAEAMTDEELEIQMAIALSLVEVQGGAPEATEMGPTRAAGATAEPTAPAHQQPGDAAALQSLLAQALSAAMLSASQPLAPGVPSQPTTAMTSASAPAAPPQQAAPTPAPAAPAPGPLLAAQQQSPGTDWAQELARQFALFQQASQQQQGAGNGGSGAAGPSQPPSAARAPAARSAPRHPATHDDGPELAPAAASATLPQWLQALPAWWKLPPAVTATAAVPAAPPDVLLLPGGAKELEELLELLSKALGVKVASPGATGAQLTLRSTSDGMGAASVQLADLQALVGMWLRRPSLAASGVSQLRALGAAHDALLLPAPGAMQAAARQVQALLGHMALQLLAADEEDLYYDKGQHTSELLRSLKTPLRPGSAGISLPFMASLATGAVADQAAADALLRLLRDVVDDVKSLKQLGASALELEPLVLSLDVVTSPLVVQRCLVHQLVSECSGAWQRYGAALVPRAGGGGGGGGGPAAVPTELRSQAAQGFEAQCTLTPLLQVSSLVEPLSVLRHKVESRAALTFTQLKGFPTNEGELNSAINAVGQLQERLQDVVHALLKRLVTLKDAALPAALPREAVLCWLAAGARINWVRTLAGERGISAQVAQELRLGASDGWCVNLTAVCLRFSRPFVEGYFDAKAGKFADLFDKHLSPSYYRTQPHRLPDLFQVNSLAGERGRSVGDAIVEQQQQGGGPLLSATAAVPWLPESLPGSSVPSAGTTAAPPPTSFIADCFFLTQTWMHVGLLPALFRYQRMAEVLQNAMSNGKEQAEGPRAQHPLMAQMSLLVSCERAALLESRLVEDTVQFCLLQIQWLHHLVRQPDAACTFMMVPDYVLSDALSWLNFIITSGLAVHVASKDVGALTAALTALLDSPKAVRSPVLADKTARLLLAMLAPQLDVSKRAQASGRSALAPTAQRPGEAALVASVLNSHAAQSGALPAALMRAYVGADHVVGLDVDRDSFDKFTMRSCIDAILEELWCDERGRRSILSLSSGGSMATVAGEGASSNGAAHGGSGGAGGAASTFDEYVGCLFNSLIYLFKDSLDRLADISKVEAARRDEVGWLARPKAEREQQEGFLWSTAHTCRGFMRIAMQALKWLNTIASHPQTGAALCRPPLSGRVAFSVLHFIEVLSSQRAMQLAVERPEQYLWDRTGLLTKVCQLATGLWASAEGVQFLQALSQEPDLDLDVLTQSRDQLEAVHAISAATATTKLLDALAAKLGLPTPPPPAKPDTAIPQPIAATPGGAPPPAKRSRTDGENGGNHAHGGEPDTIAGAAAVDGTADMEVDAQSAGAAAKVAAAADAPAMWALPGAPGLQGQALADAYKQQLGELQLGTFDATASRAYHSAFAQMAGDSEASYTPAVMKRVAREVRDMVSGRTPLPLMPAASVFLRYDQDQMHKMRAVITGPEGTPYAHGCFAFDLLFPPGYPNTPMLVQFETTGGGRARFNPNLYADGKVCLSLINTWHASHESEKWNPDVTSTFQVLVSIQAMILVEDPYYNEPAHEAARGTDTGQSSAAVYNANLTLNTLRWSMIDKLRNPPPGLEEVVRTHFQLLKHQVLATALQWLDKGAATGDEALAKRLQAAVKELHQLLADL